MGTDMNQGREKEGSDAPSGDMITPTNSEEEDSSSDNERNHDAKAAARQASVNQTLDGKRSIHDELVHSIDDSSQYSSAGDSQQYSQQSSLMGTISARSSDLGEQEIVAAKLSKQVFRFKVLVWVVLALATIGVAISIFLSTRADEEATFESIFDDHASKVMDTFVQNMDRKLGVLDFVGVSAKMESTYPVPSDWPNFVFSNFEYRAANALELTDGAMIAIVPLVSTQEERHAWENFTVASTSDSDSWFMNGKQFQATLRRTEEVHAEGAPTFMQERGDDLSNVEALHDAAAATTITATTTTAASTPTTHTRTTGATQKRRSLEENTELVSVSDLGIPTRIYTIDNSDTSGNGQKRIVDPTTDGPFLPIWQHYPLSSSLINYNMYSDDEFRDECDAILKNQDKAVLGRIWSLTDDGSDGATEDNVFYDTLLRWVQQPQLRQNGDDRTAEETLSMTPFSKVFYPIYDSKADFVAILTSIIDWSTYFDYVLPPDSTGIHVVLENTCGNVHTFQINGEFATPMGPEDLHDGKYNRLVRRNSLEDLMKKSREPSTKARHVPLDFSFCPYTISVYPSDEFHDDFVTNNATFYTVGVVAVFVFTLIIFSFYDSYVKNRQKLVLKRAIQSRAIVSSLFPAAVQERLFRSTMVNEDKRKGNLANHHAANGGDEVDEDSEDRSLRPTIFQWMPFKKNRRKTSKTGNSSRRHSAATMAGNSGGASSSGNAVNKRKLRLTDVLLNSESMDFANDGKTPIHEMKPIADLFPHTTVLFADIAGFTAWSSKRKPEHVFTLLQTVYHAFDRIAKRRSVFKVETIGDCYVAVTGLPDPQQDHAVRMVKFANECRKKMTELVEKLKIGLGEDTVQLSMRFGLHSGPVTAGVLRGERSRFQLFGNTVNIAARMENTGQSNKMHATQETADLIAEAGNVHWVEQRVVDVVDRGGFQTYFIEPNNEGGTTKPKPRGGNGNTGNKATAGSSPPDSAPSKVHRDPQQGSSEKVRAKSGASPSSHQREPRHINRVNRRINLDDKEKHLVEWNLDLFKKMLQQIIAHRQARGIEPAKPSHNIAASLMKGSAGRSVVSSVIEFPLYNKEESKAKVDPKSIELSETVQNQLRDFISFVASMHRDNSFHNFTRSSNVCVAVNKHLQRIVDETVVKQLSEPLSKFAILFAALAHGIDHSGVPNEQLVKEKARIALLYDNKSVSQQNATDLAFSALMSSDYAELQCAIFTNPSDVARFRKIVVNCMIATDLYDRELVVDRNKRWLYAFLEQGSPYSGVDKQNLLATVVMEAVVQASHYAHALQYFLSYKLWNERYFREMYNAFKHARMEEDPSTDWHAKELLFLDEIIIPLARKLKESKVLGTAGDDALTYALTNRKEWAAKGNGIAEEFVERFKDTRRNRSD